jgi:hypothetical protein
MIYEGTTIRLPSCVKRASETDIIVVILEPLRRQSPSVTVLAKAKDDNVPILQFMSSATCEDAASVVAYLQRHFLS